ncbi:MAG: HepT-like ribonuclease domain-containing protein [Thermodesulfobacteriota bacterium]
MTPLNEIQKISIAKRIDFIELELKDLEEYEDLDLDTYSRNRKVRRDVERISEDIANATIDIGKILLAGEDVELPETYRDIFKKLLQIKIVSAELAESLSNLVRLRNILAHQYLDIKWEMIKDFIIHGRNDIKVFLTIVKQLINKI